MKQSKSNTHVSNVNGNMRLREDFRFIDIKCMEKVANRRVLEKLLGQHRNYMEQLIARSVESALVVVPKERTTCIRSMVKEARRNEVLSMTMWL